MIVLPWKDFSDWILWMRRNSFGSVGSMKTDEAYALFEAMRTACYETVENYKKEHNLE